MLDFCAERDIARDIALIKMNYINEAYERMLKRDVTFRFGIDLASL
jgi:alcohol dehydrogenase (NADP+)